MDYLLAHDLGTSGNKATLFAATAGSWPRAPVPTTPATSTATGPSRAPTTGGGPRARARRSCSLASIRRIACVALSGQMMGCTPVDATHGPAADIPVLRPAGGGPGRPPAGTDRFGRVLPDRRASHQPQLCAEKLMWIHDHEPDVFQHTHRLCAQDYINLPDRPDGDRISTTPRAPTPSI